MSDKKEIRIVCSAADYMDLDEITPFQGRFKQRAISG